MTPPFILVLEFVLLLTLGVFATHRLVLVLIYFRTRRPPAVPTRTFPLEQLPLVCVQLPVFNEGSLVARILQQVSAFDYPRDRLEIQVLDDSTERSSLAIARQAVESLQARGIACKHLVREHRRGFKAGALADGLHQTNAEFIAIFDADFLPTPDFLTRTIHFFSQPELDMVQCRWSHCNSARSLLTRAEATLLDGHFQIEHTARNRSGSFFNFNGTAGIWRRTAISRAGGWQGDTLTEDLDLSYRAQLQGARFLYLPEVAVPAELPQQLSAFKSQQHRWTKGSAEVFLKLWKQILTAPLKPRVKLEAFFHLGANFCYPLLLLSGLLVLPSVYALHDLKAVSTTPLYMVLRTVFLTGFMSVVVFYFVAIRESRQVSLHRALIEVALALLSGIGLSLSNSIGVIEALLGRKSPFTRTPKTGDQESESPASVQPVRRARPWRNWLPLLETALAFYFFYTLYLALYLGVSEVLAFTLLFVISFSAFAVCGVATLAADFGVALQRRIDVLRRPAAKSH